jgi:hypothetical protein
MNNENRIRTATIVSVISGTATAVGIAQLSGLGRCIDSPAFYFPLTLIWAALGVSAITFGAAMTSVPAAWRIAIPALIIGVILLVTALIGPPYRTCGQFFAPL